MHHRALTQSHTDLCALTQRALQVPQLGAQLVVLPLVQRQIDLVVEQTML
jgi:hypothetical protein